MTCEAGRESGAFVGYVELQPVAVLRGRDADRAGAVAERVVDQVAESLLDAQPVDAGATAAAVTLDRSPIVSRPAFEANRHSAEELVQVDVIPPEPAKLWSMVNQVLSMAEDLPPVELRYEPIDLLALARAHPAAEYLFPCQASGIEVGAPVHFLDTRPRLREWTMIGCERCMQMHRHFYRA